MKKIEDWNQVPISPDILPRSICRNYLKGQTTDIKYRTCGLMEQVLCHSAWASSMQLQTSELVGLSSILVSQVCLPFGSADARWAWILLSEAKGEEQGEFHSNTDTQG